MRQLNSAMLVAAVLAIATPACPQARLPEPLESYVLRSMTEAGVPGLAIAVVHGDDPPIAQGFGVRRLGRAERVDADTVFDIASLTKSFTAAGAAALVDEGRLAWDDRVVRWLPHVAFSDPWLTEHVTLRDLLSHRTGLQAANTTMPPKRWPQREKPRLAKPPPRRRQRRRARRRSNLPHTRASTGAISMDRSRSRANETA